MLSSEKNVSFRTIHGILAEVIGSRTRHSFTHSPSTTPPHVEREHERSSTPQPIDPNHTRHGKPELYHACAENALEHIQALLRQNPTLETIDYYDSHSALLWLCKHSQYHLATLLVEAGANIAYSTKEGLSLWDILLPHISHDALNPHSEDLQSLLNAIGSRLQSDIEGLYTPAHDLYSLRKRAESECARLEINLDHIILKMHSNAASDELCELYTLHTESFVCTLKYLLIHGVSSAQVNWYCHRDAMSLLHWAAFYGDRPLMHLLLLSGAKDSTPLILNSHSPEDTPPYIHPKTVLQILKSRHTNPAQTFNHSYSSTNKNDHIMQKLLKDYLTEPEYSASPRLGKK